MITDKQKKILIGVFVGAAVLVAVLFGGETVTVLNRTNEDICELNFAYAPAEDGWGRNWLLTDIRHSHSRDVHFPLFWGWGAGKEAGFAGRAVSCKGEVLSEVTGLGGETNYVVWEVK